MLLSTRTLGLLATRERHDLVGCHGDRGTPPHGPDNPLPTPWFALRPGHPDLALDHPERDRVPGCQSRLVPDFLRDGHLALAGESYRFSSMVRRLRCKSIPSRRTDRPRPSVRYAARRAGRPDHSSPVSTPPDRHRAHARERGPVRVAVITATDTRTAADDTGGDLIAERVIGAGHEVVHREIVRDDPAIIGDLLDHIVNATDAQVILVTGGTGIAPRDTTYDAIAARLEKTLPGFGELFRMLSFAEVGAAAMLSRAVAGVYKGRVVMSMPGSPNAVRLAMDRLIIPEIAHLAWEVGR